MFLLHVLSQDLGFLEPGSAYAAVYVLMLNHMYFDGADGGQEDVAFTAWKPAFG